MHLKKFLRLLIQESMPFIDSEHSPVRGRSALTLFSTVGLPSGAPPEAGVTLRWSTVRSKAPGNRRPKVPSATESDRQDRVGQDSDENGPFDLDPLFAESVSNV